MKNMKIKEKKRILAKVKRELISIDWALSRGNHSSLSSVAEDIIEFCNNELADSRYFEVYGEMTVMHMTTLPECDMQFTRNRIGMAKTSLSYLYDTLETEIRNYEDRIKTIITILSLFTAILSLILSALPWIINK